MDSLSKIIFKEGRIKPWASVISILVCLDDKVLLYDNSSFHLKAIRMYKI
jgi:hypothetical protein